MDKTSSIKVPSKVWIGFDWKQAELVFLALFSKDSRLKEALESGDVHRYVASQVFEVDQDKVTAEQRNLAKTVSFGLIYSGFNIHTTVVNIRRDHQELDEDYIEEVLNSYSGTFISLFEWANKAVLDWYDNDGVVSYFMGAQKHIPVPEYLKRDLEKLANHKTGRVSINTYGQNSVGLLLKFVYSLMYRDEIVRACTSQQVPIFDSMNMLCDISHLYEVVQRVERYATPILRHNEFEMRMRTDWKSSLYSWGEMKSIELPEFIIEPIIYEW